MPALCHAETSRRKTQKASGALLESQDNFQKLSGMQGMLDLEDAPGFYTQAAENFQDGFTFFCFSMSLLSLALFS